MPSLAPITLPELVGIGLAEIVFTPVKLVGGQAVFADFSQPIPALRSSLTVSLTQPVKNQKLYKVRTKLMLVKEKMDMTDPLTPVGLGVVDYIDSSDTVYLFDARSSDEHRYETIQRASQLNDVDAQAALEAVYRSLEPLY